MASQVETLKALVKTANAIADLTDVSWADKYSQIFSPRISHRIGELLREFGISLDYYDPDASYREDVQAYLAALNARMAEVAPLLHLSALETAEG